MHLQKFISELKNQEPTSVRSSIYKRGILASYDPDDGRMVFYTSKNQRFSDSDSLKLECNGLIFDTQNMRPLVIPPLTYRSNIDTDVVNGHLSNNLYDVIYVNDGTVINLYWWCNSWHISTARSYDITDKKWGVLTYKEVVSNILGDSEEKFYNALDTTKSYTFGVKHADLHPFKENQIDPINTIWFIQSVSTDTLKVEYNCDKLVEFGIYTQTYVQSRVSNVRHLFTDLNQAIDDFIYNRYPEYKPLYGFILRSKDPSKTGSHSNILLESTLLQKIRQLYYHSSLNIAAQEMLYDRNTYILIYSYLDTNRHILFKKLFPQFIEQFLKLDVITATIVKNIIEYGKNKKDRTNGCDDKTQLYIKTIYEAFNNQFTFKQNVKQLPQLLTTYLLTDKWLDVYYNLYTLKDLLHK
jgi:hypothetical protein